MNVRRGVTLVEALIAIFITAIGLLAILVLFPLGAIKMAYAIQADRVITCSVKATALAEARDIRHDPLFYNPLGGGLYPDWFINNPTTATAIVPPLAAPPGALNSEVTPLVSFDGAGYPFYIDPIGVSANMGSSVGGATLIARTSTSFVGSNVAQALYWFSLLDDMEFRNDGNNAGLAGPQGDAGTLLSVNRTNKYSYGYMARRPRYSDTTVIDLSVVVYEKRPIQSPSNEYVYPPANNRVNLNPSINANTVPTEVILIYSGEHPPIRRGGWLLDATVVPSDPNTSPPNQPNMQGYFYRVSDVTDNLANFPQPNIAIQLEQPLRGTSNSRTFVILEGVVEVVERASGWKP